MDARKGGSDLINSLQQLGSQRKNTQPGRKNPFGMHSRKPVSSQTQRSPAPGSFLGGPQSTGIRSRYEKHLVK